MSDSTDFISAIRQIAAERKIDAEEIIDAIKQAIKTGFKKEYGVEHLENLDVEVNPIQGMITVFAKKIVVNKAANPTVEIDLADAKEIKKNAKLGDEVLVDITPEGDFGRIAAQTSRQIILQKLRESEKEAAIREMKDKIGTVEAVYAQRFVTGGDLICEINRARAVMPKNEQVPTEFYKLGNRIKVLLKSIEEDVRGKYILVSRSDPDFLRELFRMEVPEIDSGTVEIVSIAREAGSRSKVAVKSNSPGVDPTGSCVGQKGVRINAITNELKLGRFEEKIDIIVFDEDTKTFIMNSIRPAEVLKVDFTHESEKKAIAVVSDEQLSLAIGKDGQNVRLAAKLTGWNIDIMGETEYKEYQSKKEEVNVKGKPKKSSKKDNVEKISKTKKTTATKTAKTKKENKTKNTGEE